MQKDGLWDARGLRLESQVKIKGPMDKRAWNAPYRKQAKAEVNTSESLYPPTKTKPGILHERMKE